MPIPSSPSGQNAGHMADRWAELLSGLKCENAVPGHAHVPGFGSAHMDSRKCQKGDLFIALDGMEGHCNDGHPYIGAALQAGSTGIMASRSQVSSKGGRLQVAGFDIPKSVCLFLPDQSLDHYRKVAKSHRLNFSGPVISVCGSVGKTTTKEFLGAILSQKFNPLIKTQGSQNGFLGIPMTLFEITKNHKAAVIEIGIDEPGAMAKHMEIVNPNIAVLTSIAEEHLEKLANIETVAREELHSLEWTAKNNGVVVFNNSDSRIQKGVEHLRTKYKTATYLPYSEGQYSKFTCPLPGTHNALNLNGAITVAKHLGMSDSEIESGLQSFVGGKDRSDIRMLSSHWFLCDYYNASPASVKAALKVLSGQKGLKWAVLADMLELGPEEALFHQDLATPLVLAGVSQCFLYGPRMKHLHEALSKLEGIPIKSSHFEDKSTLANALLKEVSILGNNESVSALIKGSRSMKLEEVWDRIQASLKSQTH